MLRESWRLIYRRDHRLVDLDRKGAINQAATHKLARIFRGTLRRLGLGECRGGYQLFADKAATQKLPLLHLHPLRFKFIDTL